MARRDRIRRDRLELVGALRRHTTLLRDYWVRAFQDGDDRYLGEIAAKLRLLVYEHGRNEPLLLRLMDELGLDLPITLSGPPQFEISPGVYGGDQVSLRAWLRHLAYFTTTESGEALQLTKEQVIALWAQQSGAAHEDWEQDEVLVRLQQSGAFIGGIAADAAVLQSIASTVLFVAEGVLEKIEQDPDTLA
jgi:hypothetical protein